MPFPPVFLTQGGTPGAHVSASGNPIRFPRSTAPRKTLVQARTALSNCQGCNKAPTPPDHDLRTGMLHRCCTDLLTRPGLQKSGHLPRHLSRGSGHPILQTPHHQNLFGSRSCLPWNRLSCFLQTHLCCSPQTGLSCFPRLRTNSTWRARQFYAIVQVAGTACSTEH